MYGSTVRSTILVGNNVILACSGTTVTSIFELEQLVCNYYFRTGTTSSLKLIAVSKIERTSF